MPLARTQANIIKELTALGLLAQDQVEAIYASPDELAGDAMDELLLDDYAIHPFQLLVAKSRVVNLSPFNAKKFVQNSETYSELSHEFCVKNGILPIGKAANYYLIAVSDPYNLSIIKHAQDFVLTKEVIALLALKSDIDDKLDIKALDQQAASEEFNEVLKAAGVEFQIDEAMLDEVDDGEELGPVIKLTNQIIEDAYISGASDIHIEPAEHECRIRIRVDGVLIEKLSLPKKVAHALIARIKVMSNLDIAEQRMPQDGRIVFKQFTKKPINIDLRVSTAPLNHGEGAVMRILDKSKSTLPLTDLGYEPENLVIYKECIQRPYGMVLHCGPTGSGKSMTLYSALNEINSSEICIRTAEDPIEYTLDGLCQMQMQRKIGLTFSTALRAFLRQDPDVILVGEIRDKETAQIAIEAALTGHMLFSTLHTNDAPGTIARLSDMDIEPFMISAALICVCAQRLMRRVCPSCKQTHEPTERELEIMQKAIKLKGGTIYQAKHGGCKRCNGKGYKGRIGIHEIMITNEQLVEAINREVETAELKKVAMFNGMRTLHMDSLKKVNNGISTLEEAIACVPPDLEDLDALAEEFALKKELATKKSRDRKKELDNLRKESK